MTLDLHFAVVIGTVLLGFVPAHAEEFTPPSQTQPKPLANAYRGMVVCEKRQTALDILKAPIDLAIHDDQILYARPLFDPQGTRVLGSELGTGSVDSTGKIELTATWNVRGLVVKADYSGLLTSGGGTLTGTQTWQGPAGATGSRACHIALAAAPEIDRTVKK